MSARVSTEEFLARLDAETQRHLSHAVVAFGQDDSDAYFERGLFFLLKHIEDVYGLPLDERDIDGLHSAFRQIDVTESADLDMAVWNMLFASKTVWEVLKSMQGGGD